MQIQKNISLQPYNTFGLDAKANHFVSVTSIKDLQSVLSLKDYPNIFILGGGSNMLLTKDIEDLVIHINIKGIEITYEDANFVQVKANAGENWHKFVLWCLKHNFGGIENLSLIPGNVGSAPIQNIGAYGIELKDVFVS
ncbi:MAG: FAD-binding protein, partial [Gelidibacter sp.]|nr:FAD-binding protein [Gelidibacter sp.]